MKIIKTIEELNSMKMNGGGVIPFTRREKEYLFLMGRESLEIKWEESGTWCDFGGSYQEGESNLDGIVREFYEESHGLFGSKEELRSYFEKVFGDLLVLYSERYDGVIIFLPINYNIDLPRYFKNSVNITKDILSRKGAIKTAREKGYFEKDAIRYFSLEEIREERDIFRSTIKDILDYLLNEF